MPLLQCPNDSGDCCVESCSSVLSPIWYGKKGAKYCKHCYDTALGPKKRKGISPAAEMQQALEQASDTLVKIIKICGIRCARALEPAPVCARASGSLFFGAPVCGCRVPRAGPTCERLCGRMRKPFL